jgi:hypothetical protein
VTSTPTGGRQPRSWPRLALIEALQLPALALVEWGRWPGALWAGALIGSFVCCAGTDSGWRWRNRLLMLQAICWLAAALVLS